MLKVIQKTNIILAGILILTFATLFISTPTHAEKAKYQTEIENVLQVSFPSNIIHVKVDPGTKPFDSADFPVTVSTNNYTGYYMTITSDTADLLKTDNVSITIPTLPELEGGYTNDTFEVNKWGYKIGSGNYKPFVSGERIAGADSTVNGDVTNLNFATKVNFNQESSIYENILTFVAVANPLPTFIQNLDSSMCTTDAMVVVDNRDNQEYIIQRLADGNCWMMNNLNLGAVDLTGDLTKRNTNTRDSITAETFNSWKDRPETDYAPYFMSMTEPGFSTHYGTNDVDSVTNTIYGMTYNYCATTAGTHCTATNEANATYDLCPAGWRLPTGGDNDSSEFKKLYTAYPSYEQMRASYLDGGASFNLSNGMDSHSYGTYWSSTRYNENYMNLLFIGSGYAYSHGNVTNAVLPDDYKYTTYYHSIRCVLDPTMQGFSDTDANNLAEGQSITLTDSRDKQRYSVAKINGNVWMTKNLAIGCDGVGGTYGSNATGITLDPSDTELPNSFTMPTAGLAGVDEPRMKCSDAYGAWYNYYTVMANTIQQDYQNYYSAAVGTAEYELYQKWQTTPYSICPTGWYPPSRSEATSIAGTDYIETFKPVVGGYYWPGTDDFSSPDDLGSWWSSTGFMSSNRGMLLYRASSNEIESHFTAPWGTVGPWREGSYVRCVYRTNS